MSSLEVRSKECVSKRMIENENEDSAARSTPETSWPFHHKSCNHRPRWADTCLIKEIDWFCRHNHTPKELVPRRTRLALTASHMHWAMGPSPRHTQQLLSSIHYGAQYSTRQTKLSLLTHPNLEISINHHWKRI